MGFVTIKQGTIVMRTIVEGIIIIIIDSLDLKSMDTV